MSRLWSSYYWVEAQCGLLPGALAEGKGRGRVKLFLPPLPMAAKKKARKARKAKAKKKVVKKRKVAKKKVRKAKKVKAPHSALRATRGKKKAAKKKVAKKTKAATPKPIGKIVHYYDRIGVGIIELKGTLSMGDTVTIQRGDQKFKQAVTSMQINHQPVSSAKKGAVIGIKVKKPVKEGAVVLKG